MRSPNFCQQYCCEPASQRERKGSSSRSLCDANGFASGSTSLEAARVIRYNTPPNDAPWPAVPATLVNAGTGSDLAIQTMAAGPYGLLLSNVNVGYGSRPWGQAGTVQSASSYMTVWNMNSTVKVGWSWAGLCKSAAHAAMAKGATHVRHWPM